MTTLTHSERTRTFEDLRGLRAKGYVRDSTLDQRDGFGPEIQRNNILRFAESYGLVLGTEWYEEFVSGRQATKRRAFQQFLDDARLDLFDVLLVDHTSRFGRNQEESIRYKAELQRLGKTVVFVSQGIISGRDSDFLSERINETLDEQYSRSLSRYVTSGFAEKALSGHALGHAPLGYQTEKAASGRGARMVPDEETMPVLLELLRGYASGDYAFGSLARALNAKGRRTTKGLPFTESSVSNLLSNRFYEGKVTYRKGRPDEQVIEGAHEVPDEVRTLWQQCQEIRRRRNRPGRPSPRSRKHRVYPLTGVLVCDVCERPYHGHLAKIKKARYRRMAHSWHRCGAAGVDLSANRIERDLAEKVLAYIELDDGWRNAIRRALMNEESEHDHSVEIKRIDAALANLRKQHLWSLISDDDLRMEHEALNRQKRALESQRVPVAMPNLDHAAELLKDLPALWQHPGVKPEQQREMAREVFEEVRLRDGEMVAVKPRPQYAPLFAYSFMTSAVACGGQSPWVGGWGNPAYLRYPLQKRPHLSVERLRLLHLWPMPAGR